MIRLLKTDSNICKQDIKFSTQNQSKKKYIISFYKFHPFYKEIWKLANTADMTLILNVCLL